MKYGWKTLYHFRNLLKKVPLNNNKERLVDLLLLFFILYRTIHCIVPICADRLICVQ